MGVARLWTSMAGSVLPVWGGRCRNPPPESAVRTLLGHMSRRSGRTAFSTQCSKASRRLQPWTGSSTTPSGSMREAARCGRRSAPLGMAMRWGQVAPFLADAGPQRQYRWLPSTIMRGPQSVEYSANIASKLLRRTE